MSSKNSKGRGRPPVDTERVDTRLPRDLINGLDAYAVAQDDAPERPESIRRILRDWLSRHGFLT